MLTQREKENDDVSFNPQVETCQEKIISLELEDPKSLESPTTPTTEDFIHAQVQQRLRLSSEDSDDNQSMVTVCANNIEDTLILSPSESSDYANANVFVKYTPSIIDGRPMSNLQTIVEVVNPLLSGDGTATEIAIGRSSDESSLPSFDIEEHDGVVYRRELSLNDKMKNVLKELRENEKVRLSLSRSVDETDFDPSESEGYPSADFDPSESEVDPSASYEERTGSIGTVFKVRERLINDFYDHEDVDGSTPHEDNSQATVYVNPSVDEFLANEIRHAQSTSEGETLKARKETLKLYLNQATEAQENDDVDDDEEIATSETPTTPTTPTGGASVGAGKKKRKKNKSKKK